MQIETGDVEMPGMAAAATVVGQFQKVVTAEFMVVKRSLLPAAADELLQLVKLMDADGRLNVAKVVFEAVGDDVIVPSAPIGVPVPGIQAGAMQRKHAHGLGHINPTG